MYIVCGLCFYVDTWHDSYSVNCQVCEYFTHLVSLSFIHTRIGKPEECAGAVSFLCSDDASYITGETIVMAGGSRSRL